MRETEHSGNLLPNDIVLLFQQLATDSSSISEIGASVFLKLVRKCVRDKVWRINAPVRALSAEFKMSVNTAQKGIQELVSLNVLKIIKSKNKRNPSIYLWVSPSSRPSPTAPPSPAVTAEEKVDSNVKPIIVIKNIVEVLLFVSGTPVPAASLCKFISTSEDEILTAINELKTDYAERSLMIFDTAAGYIIVSRPEYTDYAHMVVKDSESRMRRKLSDAEMEVLAIVLYNGPISRSEIGKIRGRMPMGSLDALIEKKLVEAIEKEDSAPGFQVTSETFYMLGMKGYQDVPPLPAFPLSRPGAANGESHDMLPPSPIPS